MALKYERPTASLLSELEDVRDTARELSAYIHDANNLPPDFPKEVVEDLCQGLEKLYLGTAEGVRVPLEYARSRLPALRRQYIPKTNNEKTEQPPDRGSFLDLKVTALIASVSTALDEYRSLAHAISDDSVQEEYHVLQNYREHQNVVNKSKELGKNIEKSIQEIDEIRRKSKKMENISRSLSDVNVLNRLARSEVQFKPIVIRWLRLVSSTMADYPKVIRKIAQAIKIGVDVSRPLLKRWDTFWSNTNLFLLNEIEKTGASFEEVADVLDRSRKEKIQQHFDGALDESASDIKLDCANFRSWLLNFLVSRDPLNVGVDLQLVHAEIAFRVKRPVKDFAKECGYQTITKLVESGNNLVVVGSNLEKRFVFRMDDTRNDRVVENIRRHIVRKTINFFDNRKKTGRVSNEELLSYLDYHMILIKYVEKNENVSLSNFVQANFEVTLGERGIVLDLRARPSGG